MFGDHQYVVKVSVYNLASRQTVQGAIDYCNSHAYVGTGQAMRIAYEMQLDAAATNLIALHPRWHSDDAEQLALLSKTRLFSHLWFMDLSQSTMRNRQPCAHINGDHYLSQLEQVLSHPAALLSDIRTAAMLNIALIRQRIITLFTRSSPDCDVSAVAFQEIQAIESWFSRWDHKLCGYNSTLLTKA
ncbi:hypothetical protein EMMF5_005896 [Cystobasidiomycetes sp. EMM_F5]